MSPQAGNEARRSRQGLSRRSLLVGGGAVLGGELTVSGCSSSSKSATHPTTSSTVTGTTTSTSVAANADAPVAVSAAGLEVLAVGVYRFGLAAAVANKLGAVPPAMTAFATTVMGHHQAALDRWNTLATSAGAQAVNQSPPLLQGVFDRLLARVTDATALARVELELEQTASDTYLSVIPTLQSKTNITLAAQLQVVDQEHAAILHYLVGAYPVPDAFQNANLAFNG